MTYAASPVADYVQQPQVEFIQQAISQLFELYEAPFSGAAPKRELTEEERINFNMSGTLAPIEAPGGIAPSGSSVRE